MIILLLIYTKPTLYKAGLPVRRVGLQLKVDAILKMVLNKTALVHIIFIILVDI